MNIAELIEKHAKVIFARQADLGYGPAAEKVLRDFATELLEVEREARNAEIVKQCNAADAAEKVRNVAVAKLEDARAELTTLRAQLAECVSELKWISENRYDSLRLENLLTRLQAEGGGQ